jgi:hypothetical protein
VARGRRPGRRRRRPAFATGERFAEPPVLRSAGGRLDVALEARYGPATTAGRDVTTYSYNGQIPGPTLRLRPAKPSASRSPTGWAR